VRRTSPLVYITLIAAIALSAFPLYWLFVVATRGNDVVGDWPPPLSQCPWCSSARWPASPSPS
jgi:cellobiose transport system permease protein